LEARTDLPDWLENITLWMNNNWGGDPLRVSSSRGRQFKAISPASDTPRDIRTREAELRRGSSVRPRRDAPGERAAGLALTRRTLGPALVRASQLSTLLEPLPSINTVN
jgi:hypothetical protein